MTPLQRRTLLNLALLAVVLLLVALVALDSRDDQAAAQPGLLSLDAAQIHHLRIERPGQPPVVLQRLDTSRWQLIEPLAVAANSYRVESLLRVAALQSLGNFPAGEEALAPYQLEPPQASLIINQQLRLDFGGHTALDHRRYVRLADTIHIVPDTLFYHLIGEAHGFIAHQLLPEGARLQRLELPGLRLGREAGQWQAEPPGALRSADQIQTLLDHWQHPGIVQVRPYQGQAGTPIRLTLDNGDALEFLLIEGDGDTALARPALGIQYQLSEGSAQALLWPEDGRERN